MTVAKEPGHRGEHEISRKPLRAGMPGCSGGPVVTNARDYYTTRAAAGASAPGIPHALYWAKNSCTTPADYAAGSRTCVSPSLRGALLSAEAPPSGEGGCDEAIQLPCSRRQSWIASRSLSSGAHSRDPLARNDRLKRAANPKAE